jgi:molybdate transport system substrate-binding protein
MSRNGLSKRPNNNKEPHLASGRLIAATEVKLMDDLKILSGGAAQGLVERLAPAFKVLAGADISGEFGAVGAMAAKLRSGTPADVVILTEAIVAELTCEGLVAKGTAADVGSVETAVAIRSDDQTIRLEGADDLRKAFLAADEIYLPDTRTATAGIHVAKILAKLGIAQSVAERLRMFPNGATAMRHLAASRSARAVGCTQSTEILNTPGVTMIGPLPQGYELATTYTAAITSSAGNVRAARQLIGVLIDPQYRDLRATIGFREVRR